MTYKEIKPLVTQWAKDKNLTDSNKQYLKVFEEIGELAKGILTNDIEEIKDAIGDVCITLIIHQYQTGIIYDNDYHAVDGRCEDVSRLFGILVSFIIEYNSYTFLYLNEIANYYGTTLDECLNLAWNVVKNRTGNTINGTFIKDK